MARATVRAEWVLITSPSVPSSTWVNGKADHNRKRVRRGEKCALRWEYASYSRLQGRRQPGLPRAWEHPKCERATNARDVSVLGRIANCVGVSVFAASLLTRWGVKTIAVEAAACLVRDASRNVGSAIGAFNQPRGGRGFSGHMVIYIPSLKELWDPSLSFQGNPDLPEMLLDAGCNPHGPRLDGGPIDLAAGQKETKQELGGGLIHWQVFPKSRSWERLDWPFGGVEALAEQECRSWSTRE